MVVQYLLFIGLAVAAVGSALGMLLSRSAVYAALNLILNFVTVAAFYLTLSAPFISFSQVAVYAGAIMVLFLFVIMLLGAEQLPKGESLPWQRPLAIFLVVILLGELAYLVLTQLGVLAAPQMVGAAFGTPKEVGKVLFTDYLFPFEVISVLLLVAMVGVVVLTHRKRLAP